MTDHTSEYTIRTALWPEDQDLIRSVRQRVFVQEQKVDPELEWDGLDEKCHHVVVCDQNGCAIATGRLQSDGKIGRMAVLKAFRGQGIGGMLLETLVNTAKSQGVNRAYLHAQCHAIPFYERYGFVSYGEIYYEANIPHRSMKCDISCGNIL